MKNIKLTIIALLTVSSTFAQIGDDEIFDTWIITSDEEKIVSNISDDAYTLNQIEVTKKDTPIMLDPEDRFKVNQDVIYFPTRISKTIKSDINTDNKFDKKVVLNYIKKHDTDLDFTLSKNGIIINTTKSDVWVSKIWNKSNFMMHSNNKRNRIKNEGTYIVELTNKEKIEIDITEYNIF